MLLMYAYSSMLSGCAQVAPLSGGPRDTIPPQLDTILSTPNFQTRFVKQPIILVFDEFIDLKDVFSQVVVSPPLAKNPKVTLEKYRRVRFEFDADEALRPEATYSIQFGEAIRDYTEGNAAPIRFIFSTGDYIDSLSVAGTVVDAFTGKPAEKILVMLYDNLADSAVRVERPFYFAKTNAQGAFLIENVKADSFKVFALEDGNLNYRFDVPTERIGFLDAPVFSGDSMPAPIRIRFFQEALPLRLQGRPAAQKGLAKLAFNREPWGLEIEGLEEILFRETVGDTLFIWHEKPDTLEWPVYLRSGDWADTATVRPASRPADWEQRRLTPEGPLKPGAAIIHNPAKDIELRFNAPLKAVFSDSIQVWDDSVRMELAVNALIESADLRLLRLQFSWEEEKEYQLLLLPGTLEAWQGLRNDSLELDYRIASRKDFGTIFISIDSLDTELAYVAELLQQDKVLSRFPIAAGAERWETRLINMDPGSYQLRLIEDRNGNDRWDPGHYDEGLQPERLLIWTIEQLRANWDVEAKFTPKWE